MVLSEKKKADKKNTTCCGKKIPILANARKSSLKSFNYLHLFSKTRSSTSPCLINAFSEPATPSQRSMSDLQWEPPSRSPFPRSLHTHKESPRGAWCRSRSTPQQAG